MKKETRKKLRQIGILSGIFFAALIVYFIWSFNSMEKSNTIYSSLDEPKMPVAYVEMNGIRMNPMHAYVQDMGDRAERDAITVLPADRQLKLLIEEYSSMVVTIQYEIRSLDLKNLIESGSVTEITRENGTAEAVLPIQNLIQKDQEYLLSLALDTGEQVLHYYTRILWTDQNYAQEMISLAQSFTQKSFDYEAAKDLTAYLESNDTADNSSLGHVDIQSSFSQLTWRETGMELLGDMEIWLKECAGVMSEVQIRYTTKRILEDGSEEYYQNEDNYVFRYDPQRIFIMDFDRVTNEIFTASTQNFADNRLILGITNEEFLQTMYSDSEQFIAFRTADSIWRYDQKGKSCVNVFSYLSEAEYSGARAIHPEHQMKILNCKNNGDVDFLVYGYLNRGRHEGYNGIVYYTYDNSADTIIENFFIPIADNYEKIEYNVNKLAYISKKDMLFLYHEGCIYGIDINSMETITVVAGLEEGEFAVSAEGNLIAWQNRNENGNDSITLMDLKQDQSSVIQEEEADVKVLGFIGEDLVYGICSSHEEVKTEKEDLPIQELKIVDASLNELSSYYKDGYYLSGIRVDENRIHLDLSVMQADGSLMVNGNDTIIANQEQENSNIRGISSYISSDKGKIYYISIQDLNGKMVSRSAPETISYENTSSLELNVQNTEDATPVFDAYALGHYIGSSQSLKEAVDMAYEGQGYVLDEANRIVWNRTDKETIVTVKNPQQLGMQMQQLLESNGNRQYQRSDNLILMNAEGMDLNSILYYVGKGTPVLTSEPQGIRWITAYDQFNITIMNPQDGTKVLMGKNDAENYFASLGYPFTAAIVINR